MHIEGGDLGYHDSPLCPEAPAIPSVPTDPVSLRLHFGSAHTHHDAPLGITESIKLVPQTVQVTNHCDYSLLRWAELCLLAHLGSSLTIGARGQVEHVVLST